MLRYYVYVYACGAAVTAYIGFLQLSFEEKDNRYFPAFEPADNNGEQNVESARNRMKRQILERMPKNDDPLIKKVEEFHRVVQAMKLRKLQHQSPPGSKVKVTKRSSFGLSEAPLTVEEGTRRIGKRKKRQTEATMSTEMEKRKEKKNLLRRAKRDKAADAMLQKAHSDSDQMDIYRGDPNDFFDEEKQELDDNQVQEGVAKQLFVVHWIRTLGYFILLQALIFFILFFAFWSYGYYQYEVWKFKVGSLYKGMVEMFQLYNKPQVGTVSQTEEANIHMEETQEKLEEERDKRDEVLMDQMREREEAEALQKAAQENVRRVKKERARRKKSKGEKSKGEKSKDEKSHKSKDKHKSTTEADGKKRKSKRHKKGAKKSGEEPKQEEVHPATPHPEPGPEAGPQNLDPNAHHMVPEGYYPDYYGGYYPGYH